jgi:hypothetical protein
VRRDRNILLKGLGTGAVPLILGDVWVYVAVWAVQTGEVEQLHVGDVVEQLGVRATFWTLEQTDLGDGVVELLGPDPSGDASPHYRVVGTVAWTREPHTLVVSVGTFEVLAEPQAIGPPDSWGPDGAPLEPVFPYVGLPAVGDRVALVATLSSILDYEPDAFGYPDVSADWSVRGLRVEHRELVPSPAFPGGSEPGRIVRVVEIPRMLRWADAPRHGHASYLLDLVAAR